MGAELFMRTDGYDEANSRFSQFCERAEELRVCTEQRYKNATQFEYLFYQNKLRVILKLPWPYIFTSVK